MTWARALGTALVIYSTVMMNINYSSIICTQFYLEEKNVLVLSKLEKTTVLFHFLTENHLLGFAKLWSLCVEVMTREGYMELGFHQAESSPNTKYLVTCG